jgi:amino acid permease
MFSITIPVSSQERPKMIGNITDSDFRPFLSLLCPFQVLVWCLLGALLECVGGLRPVNVAFALLIFILIFLFLFLCKNRASDLFKTADLLFPIACGLMLSMPPHVSADAYVRKEMH